VASLAPREHVQERRLPRPRGPNQGHHPTRRYAAVDVR
jgi:hypothetical protein